MKGKERKGKEARIGSLLRVSLVLRELSLKS